MKKGNGSKPEGAFYFKNLDLRINKEVKESIDFDNKKVILENEEISYEIN